MRSRRWWKPNARRSSRVSRNLVSLQWSDTSTNGTHFESRYFLTLLFLPPAVEAARAERFLYEGHVRAVGTDTRETLAGFIDRTDRVLQLIEGFMPDCTWLEDAKTLTYLHATISTKVQRVREVPMRLDALLADQPLTAGLDAASLACP